MNHINKKEIDSCLIVVKNVGQNFQEQNIARSNDERWLGSESGWSELKLKVS